MGKGSYFSLTRINPNCLWKQCNVLQYLLLLHFFSYLSLKCSLYLSERVSLTWSALRGSTVLLFLTQWLDIMSSWVMTSWWSYKLFDTKDKIPIHPFTCRAQTAFLWWRTNRLFQLFCSLTVSPLYSDRQLHGSCGIQQHTRRRALHFLKCVWTSRPVPKPGWGPVQLWMSGGLQGHLLSRE